MLYKNVKKVIFIFDFELTRCGGCLNQAGALSEGDITQSVLKVVHN